MGLTLIKALTASGSASLDFVDGASDVVMDNTYNEYQFYFVNLHPEENGKDFGFQVNATDDAGGGYDTSQITSTHFRAYHAENGTGGQMEYRTGADQANGTGYQLLQEWVGATDGSADDNGISGTLTLYDPSSTTYVKHFVATTQSMYDTTSTYNGFTGGYINDTTAIDEISFKMSSGNIDAGTIYMYGVS